MKSKLVGPNEKRTCVRCHKSKYGRYFRVREHESKKGIITLWQSGHCNDCSRIEKRRRNADKEKGIKAL